jgi:signal peptidase I
MHPLRRRHLLTVTAVIAMAVLWLSGLAPVQLGGTLSSMAVSGISMEPTIHDGELVVLRQDADLGVGDVAAYRNADAKATFLHRIVATQGDDGFIFQGDNLGWRDPGVATRAQIKGVLWFKLPVGGNVLAWFQEPVHGAVLAVGGLLLAGLLQRRRKRRAGASPAAQERQQVSRRPPQSNRLRGFERALLTVAVASMGIALLSAGSVAFSLRPGQAKPGKVPSDYTHTVEFDYSAPVPRSVVYPDGEVTSADPLFPAMVPRLSVRYVYRLETARDAAVHGTAVLRLRLENSAGWRRTFLLAPPKPFTGPSVAVRGPVDLAQLRSLTATVDGLTGVPGAPYTATIESVVELKGTVDGVPLEEEPFRATFPLSLTAPTAGEDDSLAQTEERSLTGRPASAPASKLAKLRPLAAVAAAVGAVIALAAWLLMRRRVEWYDEPSRIAIRYGKLLTPLAAPPRTDDSVLQVEAMEDLVRLARMYGSAIFEHGDARWGYEYLTQANGVVHRYSIAPGPGERSRPPAM